MRGIWPADTSLHEGWRMRIEVTSGGAYLTAACILGSSRWSNCWMRLLLLLVARTLLETGAIGVVLYVVVGDPKRDGVREMETDKAL